MTKQQLDEIRKRAAEADTLICKLASGVKKWTMSIPVQKDDTDMTLIEPVRTDIPALLEHIESLQGQLKEAREVIGFYAHPKSWSAHNSDISNIVNSDSLDKAWCGGSRARAYLEKYPNPSETPKG